MTARVVYRVPAATVTVILTDDTWQETTLDRRQVAAIVARLPHRAADYRNTALARTLNGGAAAEVTT